MKMADVAGNGCTSADASLRCNTQELNPRSLGSLGERANRASEPSNHVLVRPRSWNSMPVGMGGGAQPTFWCPLPFRSTRHALNPRSLSFSDVESKLADGRGGPTSTSTRKKRLIVRDHSAPRSHPCSSQYAIEHACAPDLSPGIHHVVA